MIRFINDQGRKAKISPPSRQDAKNCADKAVVFLGVFSASPAAIHETKRHLAVIFSL